MAGAQGLEVWLKSDREGPLFLRLDQADGAAFFVVFQGINALKGQGFSVDAIAPQGAIYLSARFNLYGKTTPQGDVLKTSEDIRGWLLREAGLAVVPFHAFGAEGESGWCRLSVGAVSLEEIAAALPRLGAGLAALR